MRELAILQIKILFVTVGSFKTCRMFVCPEHALATSALIAAAVFVYGLMKMDGVRATVALTAIVALCAVESHWRVHGEFEAVIAALLGLIDALLTYVTVADATISYRTALLMVSCGALAIFLGVTWTP